jgi:hypothetical protein
MTNLKWLNFDGTAGTGKSFLIWVITTALRELFSDGTITINFQLMIPVKEGSEFNQLGQSSLTHFQT